MTYWDPIVRCSGSWRYNLDDGVALNVQELIIHGRQVFWKAGALTKVGKKELCWRNTNGWGNRTGQGDALHPKAGKPFMKGRGGEDQEEEKEGVSDHCAICCSLYPSKDFLRRVSSSPGCTVRLSQWLGCLEKTLGSAFQLKQILKALTAGGCQQTALLAAK